MAPSPVCQWWARICAALLCSVALQAGAAAPQPSDLQAAIDALTRASLAVVGVQVTATEGALTADTLGRERSGSGVVIGPDGLILTIGYLMLEADTIQVTTHDHHTLPARAVAYDAATGFGLLRLLLPLPGIAPVPMGMASEASTTEPLMTAAGGQGTALAMTQLVSRRPFSAYWEYHIEDALFTSPPLRKYSGAPLFNQRGELLGIGSLYVSNAMGDSQRLPGNMFVPIDLLKPILSELQATGSTRGSRRPWLGISSAEQGGRLRILRVSQDSPAQAAGLEAGDLVLAIDGASVSTLEAFYEKLWAHASPDDEVQLTVVQGSEIRQLTLKAVDRMTTMRKPAGI